MIRPLTTATEGVLSISPGCMASEGFICQRVIGFLGGGGPDVTDERLPRRRSRYEQPDWEDWTEEDERALQLALAKTRPQQQQAETQLILEGFKQPIEQPQTLEQQARQLRPVVDQVQAARGITRLEAIAAVTSGMESQLVVAHREQLITDDELLVLMLTIM